MIQRYLTLSRDGDRDVQVRDLYRLNEPVMFTGTADEARLWVADQPVQEAVDCPYQAAHAEHHVAHPFTGRVICLRCHPPAQRLLAEGRP